MDGYLKMVWVAYGFDGHEGFWNATSRVLRFYDAAAMADASCSDERFLILPEHLLVISIPLFTTLLR